MQDSDGRLRRLAGGILWIGFGVQVCIGIIWLLAGFGGFPTPGESLFGVDMSRPAACIQRFVQLVAAAGAADLLLGTFGLRAGKERICGVLVMLTFPMAMQCHLSLRADSLLSSLELVLIAGIIRWALAKGTRETPPKKNKVRVIRHCAVFLTLIVLAGSFGTYAGRGERHVKGINRFYAGMFSRYAWTGLRGDYNAWPAELQEAVPYQIMLQTRCYADNVEYILMPYLEETCASSAQIGHLMGQIVRFAIQRNTRGIAQEIVWDAAGYTLSPVVLQLQLAGRGYDSYAGVNYDHMLQRAPRLSAYYMTYGCRWFGLAWVVTALWEISALRRRKSFGNVGEKTAGWVCVCAAAAAVLFYTFRGAGMMDYRKTLMVVLLWIAWMLRGMNGMLGKSRDEE